MVTEQERPGPSKQQPAPADRQQGQDGAAGTQTIVGCALLPKKVARYLTQRMLQTAANNNIQIKQIDYTQPLEPQGPFHVIIHKLRPNPDWEQQLRQYVSNHPETVVVDRIDKIRQLHNRATMLRPLQGDGIVLQQPVGSPTTRSTCGALPHPGGCINSSGSSSGGQVMLVQAPLQVEIAEGTTEAEAQAALAAAGLAPPLLCKPLWTDGRDGSHKLAVLHDLEALGRLLRGSVCNEFKPPLVVQQFVEHGGVLFKVYVLGAQTYVTARPSLGETVLEPAHAVQQLPRISCVSVFSKQEQHRHQMQTPQAAAPAAAPSGAAAAEHHGQQHAAQQQQGCAALGIGTPHQQQEQQQQPSAALAAVTAESVWRPPRSIVAPPAWLTSALAATLRQELGMQLFNFDLIVPEQQPVPVFDGSPRQQQQLVAADSGPDAAPALCYVVDINFFPGVDKIPQFEQRFVDFLLSAAEGGPDGPDCAMQRYQQQLQVEQQQQQVTAAAAQGQAAAEQSSRGGSGGLLLRSRPSSSGGGCGGGSARGDYISKEAVQGRRSRSSSGGCGGSRAGCGRRLQHSLSAERAPAGPAPGGGMQHGRRPSGGGGSGSAAHSSGPDVAGLPAQWADRGVLGSSPPQLQVAGCS